ncbi:Nup133p [Sporobolomyces salmoneus]|uniref:Nup133p n=1 Tax=Sporobolomyces salmoneus TaxID=183962 RepID=UPI003181AF62
MFSSGVGTPPTTRVSRRAASRASRASVAPSTTTSLHAPSSVTASTRTATTLRAPSRGASGYGGSDAGMMELEEDEGQDQQTLSHLNETKQEKGQQLDKVLVKDESYIVTERKGLPVEVQQAISLADPYTQPVQAVLDPTTGFALLVTNEYCFVWNWSQTSPSSTTYVFPLPSLGPLPSSIKAYSPLSFACLVPSSSSSSAVQREPGLLVLSPTGQLRLWESVSLSLSGVDRFKSSLLPSLDPSGQEVVRTLQSLSPTCYLATTTSTSKIYVITINSVGGRVELNTRVLEKNVGWASSILSSVFGGSGGSSHHSREGINPKAGVLSLAISRDGQDRQVFAVMEKTAQVWNVASNGAGERLVSGEVDVFAGVLEALEGKKVGNEQWAINEGKVEIVDSGVTPKGELALLVSHVTGQTSQGFQSFAIVLLNVVGSIVEAVGVTRLNYQSRPDPRPLSTPKLSLSNGETAFVVFADAVVIVSFANDSPFEENFPLRHNTNQFIGLSLPSAPSSRSPASTTLSLLTSTASLLNLTVTPPASPLPLSITNTSETYKTRKLKSKIEHAIYFGITSSSSSRKGRTISSKEDNEEEENLFKFDLQKDYEGDLAVAAEGVSQDLLASASPNLPVILDLRAQLTDRAHRARALIEYIQDNGLVGKLPKTTRRKLSWDAERIVAAGALWSHLNARLGEQTVLSESILTFMDEIGEGFGEDPLRLFFRSKLGSLGNVVEEVSKQAKSVVSSSSASSETKSPVLYEANQVVNLVFSAIARHRLETLSLYSLDSSSLPLEAWSSRVPLLEGLQWHFEATHSLLSERIRDFGANPQSRSSGAGQQEVGQEELKKQMALLAEFTFSAIEERLLYLRTLQGDGPTQPETRSLNEKYLVLRPKFIKTLVSIEKISAAFELAERHSDFRSLVELSTDLRHGSLPKVRSFLDKYGKEFAFPLYEYYLEQGQTRSLLEPDEAHRPLLTAFLDETKNTRLAWINDIAVSRYEHAKEALVVEATTEQNLKQKEILFSLGKLAQLAQTTRESIETESVQRAIEAVDDQLDLVNAQQKLRQDFDAHLSQADESLSPQERGELVTGRLAPTLEDRQEFAKIYAFLAARLLSGSAVTPEELIELQTLKKNTNDHSGDFASALDILVRAKDLPRARKQLALESIWRRVYIQDDWAALRSATGLRDEEMSQALRSTAFYSTLSHAAGSNHPPSLYLEPLQSLSSSTLPLLAALHPSMSQPELELLQKDYETENRRLEKAVREDGVESFAKEVVRLLRADQEDEGAQADGQGEEVEMIE